VRFVRTTALKHQQELDESSSAKSDLRDAFTIGNIVREGKYIDTIIEDGVFRELRTLSHTRERILRLHIGSTHLLQAVLNDYFPELRKIFWSMKAKGLMALLSIYPFPGMCSTQAFPQSWIFLRRARGIRPTVQSKHKGFSPLTL